MVEGRMQLQHISGTVLNGAGELGDSGTRIFLLFGIFIFYVFDFMSKNYLISCASSVFTYLFIYIYIYIYICVCVCVCVCVWSEIFESIGQKVKPNMVGMEALSFVGFSPSARFLRNT